MAGDKAHQCALYVTMHCLVLCLQVPCPLPSSALNCHVLCRELPCLSEYRFYQYLKVGDYVLVFNVVKIVVVFLVLSERLFLFSRFKLDQAA